MPTFASMVHISCHIYSKEMFLTEFIPRLNQAPRINNTFMCNQTCSIFRVPSSIQPVRIFRFTKMTYFKSTSSNLCHITSRCEKRQNTFGQQLEHDACVTSASLHYVKFVSLMNVFQFSQLLIRGP